MMIVHPQYLTDENGNRSMVVLPAHEFELLMEELEELEDIRLYDEVKKNDSGERIAMDDAFEMIEFKRKASK